MQAVGEAFNIWTSTHPTTLTTIEIFHRPTKEASARAGLQKYGGEIRYSRVLRRLGHVALWVPQAAATIYFIFKSCQSYERNSAVPRTRRVPETNYHSHIGTYRNGYWCRERQIALDDIRDKRAHALRTRAQYARWPTVTRLLGFLLNTNYNRWKFNISV